MCKKVISIILAAIMLLPCMSMMSFAQDEPEFTETNTQAIEALYRFDRYYQHDAIQNIAPYSGGYALFMYFSPEYVKPSNNANVKLHTIQEGAVVSSDEYTSQQLLFTTACEGTGDRLELFIEYKQRSDYTYVLEIEAGALERADSTTNEKIVYFINPEDVYGFCFCAALRGNDGALFGDTVTVEYDIECYSDEPESAAVRNRLLNRITVESSDSSKVKVRSNTKIRLAGYGEATLSIGINDLIKVDFPISISPRIKYTIGIFFMFAYLATHYGMMSFLPVVGPVFGGYMLVTTPFQFIQAAFTGIIRLFQFS